jgi:heat-inducible transcriptional repressor
MDLDERNKRVLQAVIDSYIDSGLPIGSQVLAKRYDFGVSSATLRNIMAELEELGLLTHPHTSAGRIPTDRGYRYYIDSLISTEREPEEMSEHLPEAAQLHSDDIHELMQEASKFLASLSHCAGIVVAPVETEVHYRHIEFVRLRGRQVLIIFVTPGGVVQNKLLDLDESIRQNDLNRFSMFLDEELESYTIDEIRERLIAQMKEHKTLFSELMEETYRASLDVLDRDHERVYVGGASQIIDTPEFASVDKMRALFKAFEDKYLLLKLLDNSVAAQGIKVFIGAENPFFGMQECSMVVGSYGAGTGVVGTLGVIGPTRMQYKQVIHVVDYTAKLLSKLLEERFQRGIQR